MKAAFALDRLDQNAGGFRPDRGFKRRPIVEGYLVEAFNLGAESFKILGLPAGGESGSGERRVMHADQFVPAGDLTLEYALPDRNKEITAWAYKMEPWATATTPASAVSKAKTPEEKQAFEAAHAIASDASPYVAIALRPKLPRWQEAKERVHAIVVDTSRSMIGERYSRATRGSA